MKLLTEGPDDVVEAYADTTKANKILGWRAKNDLEAALKTAWEWEKKNTLTTNSNILIMNSSFESLDYLIFVLYALVILGSGTYGCFRNKEG